MAEQWEIQARFSALPDGSDSVQLNLN